MRKDSDPVTTRYVVIMDIHGCFEEMRLLLNKVGLRPSDHLILGGDLIDKGPRPVAVVQYLRTLPCRTTFIMGNHEERFLRWCRYEDRRERTGEENPIKNHVPPEYKDQRAGFTRHDLAWLRKGVPAFQFTSGDHKFVCIHAGIPTYASEVPKIDLTKKRLNPWIRLRHVSKETGHFIGLGHEGENTEIWAEHYDRRLGYAIFGHQCFYGEAPRFFQNAVGIDGGCVHGGHLRAMTVTNGNIFHLSVEARKSYAPKYKPTPKHVSE